MRASGVKRNLNSLAESSQFSVPVLSEANMAGNKRAAVLDGKGVC
jgi:hypothetical protein